MEANPPSSDPSSTKPSMSTARPPRFKPKSPVQQEADRQADEQSYITRPNRYFGPSSTYLSWIENERTTALSLDRVHGQDLSLHLFAAHLLRRGIERLKEDGDRAGRGRKRSKGKQRARSISPTTDDGNGEDGEGEGDEDATVERAHFPKSWTAWPLPPSQVPTARLIPPAVGDEEFRTLDPDERLSADLEGWTIATATRIARERWEARQWEDGGGMENDGNPISGSRSGGGNDSPDVQYDDVDEPMFLSQPMDLSSSPSPTSSPAPETIITGTSSPPEDRRPVPLVDDDKARQVFLPTARHILTKVDDLLIGLHKMRYAYASKPAGKARGRSQSRKRTAETEAEEEGSDESPHRGRSRSRPRKRARSESVASEISALSAVSTSSDKKSRRLQNLGLRDWSDVLGVAALTGWNPEVVERARERCGKLFGENLLFRTIGGSLYGGQAEEDEVVEELAADEGTDNVGSEHEDEEETGPLTVRTSKPCQTCVEGKFDCRPAESSAWANSTSCDRCVKTNTICSGIKISQSNDERTCPHRDCARHHIPFAKHYHLQRHVDGVHCGNRPGSSYGRSASNGRSISVKPAASERFSSRPGSSSPLEQEQEHEYLCPVSTCLRSRRPFLKGKNLYEHVRNMHPEIDVVKIKEREASRRTERRGRWRDERRFRSKSRTRARSETSTSD
jgi:hypothetical protein